MTSIIALDGPGAAGKTTVGVHLAERLGYRFVDTGLTYRAVTVLALESGADLEDDGVLTRLAMEANLSLRPKCDGSVLLRIFTDERDLSEAISRPEVDRAVSRVSSVVGVRRELVALQRRFASQGRVVMAGRDIGTEVLPDASLKIYLDASAEERAKRRFEEREKRGDSITYERVLEDLTRRDGLDQGREVSPLTVAEDALRIDTTLLALEDVVDTIERLTTGQ